MRPFRFQILNETNAINNISAISLIQSDKQFVQISWPFLQLQQKMLVFLLAAEIPAEGSRSTQAWQLALAREWVGHF